MWQIYGNSNVMNMVQSGVKYNKWLKLNLRELMSLLWLKFSLTLVWECLARAKFHLKSLDKMSKFGILQFQTLCDICREQIETFLTGYIVIPELITD